MESRTMEHRRASMLVSIFFSSYQLLKTRVWSDYKNKGGLKQDDLRRRREEQQVEIRRQKREENIAKRRNFLPSASADSDEEATTSSWEPPVRTISSISRLSTECACSLRKKWLVACSLMIPIASWMQPRSSGNCCQKRGTLQSRRSSNVVLCPVSLNSFGLALPCYRFVVPSLALSQC